MGIILRLTVLATGLLAGAPPAASGQEGEGIVAGALLMRQLDGVKRVLMIAAHPDDEDTGLLAAVARGMGAETAYLSLTRGEGGQNLIGGELGEGLGIVRTGELLAARTLDGGSQFFTRAFDFGYSKNMAETLEHWPLEEVLRDAVFVVRSFRPQVIVSVFSGTPRDGHGQHQVAGQVARRAFRAAGDPDRFPELAGLGVEPWQPTKLYRSVRFSPGEATMTVSTGAFDAVLGRSHFQLAMESRSQHRSQDMGTGQWPGPRRTSLKLEETAEGTPSQDSDQGIFSGIDTTLVGQLPSPLGSGWPRDTRKQISAYRETVRAAVAGPWLGDPRQAVAALGRASGTLAQLVQDAPQGAARDVLARRLEQATAATLAMAGVVIDVRLSRDILTPGEEVVADLLLWNGGATDIGAVDPELILPDGWSAQLTSEGAAAPPSRFFRLPPPPTPEDGRVRAGEIVRWSWTVRVPADAEPSVPYYLRGQRQGGLYAWPADPARWAQPLEPSPVRARIGLKLEHRGTATGTPRPPALFVEREATFVGVDKATGEYRRRVLVLPAINVALDSRSMVWPMDHGAAREVNVVLTNRSAHRRSGSVHLEVPDGWRVEPETLAFSLGGSQGSAQAAGGPTGSFTFQLRPETRGGAPVGTHAVRVVARQRGVEGAGSAGERDFFHHAEIIDYPHIPRAARAEEAVLRIEVFPVAMRAGLRIGYIMGSGDGGAAALRQLGIRVDELTPAQVGAEDFSDYNVLVLGVRVYETRPDVVRANAAILDFARRGGTVIAQYNKYEFAQGGFAPYPLAMRRPHDRVTDETAPVTMLAPESPAFAGPNRIDARDFQGWVQERGLYFASEWDPRYQPVMAMADPGEEPKRGGLLVAPVGEGLYVYCALALFRQYPAGVPGAHRLLANLVSMRADDWRRVP